MSDKQQSQEVQARLRAASDRIGVPQYVVMARALELFDEEVKETLREYADRISPENVDPRAGEKVRGARLTSGQKAAQTRKRNAAGQKAAETRKRAKKRTRCEFCDELFHPQGLARHLSPKSKVDCALAFRKQKRTK